MEQGDSEGAAQLLKSSFNQMDKGQRKQARLALVQIYLAENDVKAAEAHFQFEDLTPSDLPGLVLVLDSMIVGGRANFVQKWEPEIRRIEGEGGTFAAFLKSRRLLGIKYQNQKHLDAAISEVRKLLPILSKRPNWSGYHLVQAVLAEAEGKQQETTKHLELVVEFGDHRAWVLERLVTLYHQQSRIDKARNLLSRITKLQFQSSQLSTIAILTSSTLSDAKRIARKALDTRPDDASAHFWLGAVLNAQDETEKAHTHLSRATELAPDSLQVWNALFSFYLQQDDEDRALETLNKLASNVGRSESEKLLLLAQGYEHVSPERARSTYMQSLAVRTANDKKNVAILAACAAYFVRIGDLAEAKLQFFELLKLAKERGERSLIGATPRIGGDRSLRRRR